MKKTLAFLTALLALAACGGKEPVATPTAPAAPTGLKVHAATESSLTFQWNVVEGAAAYDWQIQKDGATVDEGHIKTRNKTVDKLAAGEICGSRHIRSRGEKRRSRRHLEIRKAAA